MIFNQRMLRDFLALLATPSASLLVAYHEHRILRAGRRLDDELADFAEGLGIENVEGIRVLLVDEVPSPVPQWLANFLQRRGFPVGRAAGMCMGRGIYVTRLDAALIRHELVHTLQYQRLGGTTVFLREYLTQCFRDGYADAELEREARDLSAKNPQLRILGVFSEQIEVLSK